MLSANDSIVTVITFLFLSEVLITMSKVDERWTDTRNWFETRSSVSLLR